MLANIAPLAALLAVATLGLIAAGRAANQKSPSLVPVRVRRRRY